MWLQDCNTLDQLTFLLRSGRRIFFFRHIKNYRRCFNTMMSVGRNEWILGRFGQNKKSSDMAVPEVVPVYVYVMAPTKSTKGKEVQETNVLSQKKASATTRPGKRPLTKRQREASSLEEDGRLPGVQKIKSALRQTRRLLAKVCKSASFC